MPRLSPRYNLHVTNPSLSREWHPSKNGSLTPKDVTPGSGKRVWWLCSKQHAWTAPVADRTSGKGCPYCTGQAVCKDNCLHTLNPALSKEWHPDRNNGLTPKDVTSNSNKKVWWVCDKGHEWEAKINSRNGGKGCPYCTGKKVCKDNCLRANNPSLSKEWHPTKNGRLTPKDVSTGSKKKVWWICSKNHVWQATVESRNRGTGCPYCAGRKVCTDNCLQTINPELSKEWHPKKNGRLTPKDVTAKSNRMVWWVCSRGHQWQNTVKNRNRGTGCPYCAGRITKGKSK
jgi:hypothetical protein